MTEWFGALSEAVKELDQKLSMLAKALGQTPSLESFLRRPKAWWTR
ncbi:MULTISPECIES: hypothetical protein [unclassified Bradyrhizobium]|nr:MULTISPECIES: hypothetical protein [unclassified Bradyrhizobium]MCP3397041.1 hypothetical protein [Bradyrhizobium sp. CCGB20]MCP3405551.1 hypothetical protein [Bradyrhizobium sp. CCGB01]